VKFLLLLLLPLAGQAAEADLFQDLFAAPRRPGNNRVSYEGQIYSQAKVQGTALEQSQLKQKFRVSHTLRTEPSFLNIEGSAELDQTKNQAIFPESLHSLPHNFWNVGISSNYRTLLENDRTLGASVSIGSPSDKPFHSLREVSLSGNITYRFPAAHANDQWLLLVNESNTRGFLPWIPIPGAGYLFDRSADWKFFLGFPVLGFFWRPGGKWLVNGFYFPVMSGQLEVNYFLFGPAKFYLGFRSGQDVYLRAGRDDRRDRLFAQERDLHLGFTVPLSRKLIADISSRYAFKRGYYEGKGFSDRKTGRRIDIDPALTFGLKLVAIF
jgi:hypothetical protein